MTEHYIFKPDLVRAKLNSSISANVKALALQIQNFFNAHGDPATNALTVWGHRANVYPNMGVNISVSDEGPLGTSANTQVLITLYRDDGLKFEAYSTAQGQASAMPSAAAHEREIFLQFIGELQTVYASLGAFPLGTTVLPKTA